MDEQFIEFTIYVVLVAGLVGSFAFGVGGITAWKIVKWDNNDRALSIYDAFRGLLILVTFGFISFGFIAFLLSSTTLIPFPDLLDSMIESILSDAHHTSIFEASLFGTLIGFLIIVIPVLFEVITFKLTGKRLGLYILGKKTSIRN